jgi:hypothetical protein
MSPFPNHLHTQHLPCILLHQPPIITRLPGATMGACATKPKTLEGKVPEEVACPTSTPKVALDTTVSNEVADTLINHFFLIVDLIFNT